MNFALCFTGLFLLFGFVFCQNKPLPTECGDCDRGMCPVKQSTDCIAGITRDKCDCCQICAQAEGDLCDLPGDAAAYGECGGFLDCQRQDSGVGECVCENQDTVCGSNGVEYSTICKLREDKVRSGDADLVVQYVGSCKAGKTGK